MASLSIKRVCITGSNAGVGYETARQLSLLQTDDKKWQIQSIILACRNPTKAQEAKTRLEQETGRTTDCFEIMIIDLSDLSGVEKAVDSLPAENPIDCLILNAGGFAGNEPTAVTSNGTMKIFDSNVLGSVYLTDLLIQRNKLKTKATTTSGDDSGYAGHVLYVSSECSRGVRGIDARCSQHVFTDGGSLEEMKNICNGSYFHNQKKEPNDLDVYGRVKLIGNLWTGCMARKFAAAKIRFVAVSPGNTAGTNVVNRMNKPSAVIWLANNLYLPLMVHCGRFHSLAVGAQRYLDVLEDTTTYQNGHFYATATRWNSSTGRKMCDQIDYAPTILYKSELEDNANEAIHSFLPTTQHQTTYR